MGATNKCTGGGTRPAALDMKLKVRGIQGGDHVHEEQLPSKTQRV